MESAALWTACRHRGAATATVHEIRDYLDSEERTPGVPADRDSKETRPRDGALTDYLGTE